MTLSLIDIALIFAALTPFVREAFGILAEHRLAGRKTANFSERGN